MSTCPNCLECQRYFGPCGFCNNCVSSGLAPDNWCDDHHTYACGGGDGKHKKFLVDSDHYPCCKVMGCDSVHPSDKVTALADFIHEVLPPKKKRKAKSKKKKPAKRVISAMSKINAFVANLNA